MNNLNISGRLVADPTINTTANGVKVARLRVAVNREYKNAEGKYDTDFFEVSAFRGTAEFAEKYLTKGRKVIIQGRIENNNYTNREGQKVYGTRIVAEKLEPCDRRVESADAPAPAAADDGPITEAPEEDFFPDEDMPDLPFA